MSDPITMVSDTIALRIRTLRGQRVIIDSDLAALYGVTTKRLNEQVKRNAERFPDDFVFRLDDEEARALRSRSATSNLSPPASVDELPPRRGGRRSAPFVFTEHGAIMAATVLNGARAVEVSIYVVRAFVRLRELLTGNPALADRLREIERKLEGHDAAIIDIVEALRQLMAPPAEKKHAIGFVAAAEK